VNDGSRLFLSTALGAAMGAAAGYLYFTDGGRHLRRRIDPKLDEAMHEIRRLRSTVNKVRVVASEGVAAVAGVVNLEGDRAWRTKTITKAGEAPASWWGS
jgi:hypothetical protein